MFTSNTRHKVFLPAPYIAHMHITLSCTSYLQHNTCNTFEHIHVFQLSYTFICMCNTQCMQHYHNKYNII